MLQLGPVPKVVPDARPAQCIRSPIALSKEIPNRPVHVGREERDGIKRKANIVSHWIVRHCDWRIRAKLRACLFKDK